MLSKSTEDRNEVVNNRICHLAEVDSEAALGAYVTVYLKKRLHKWLKSDDRLLTIDQDNGIDDAGH
jgi:hypothetical protein